MKIGSIVESTTSFPSMRDDHYNGSTVPINKGDRFMVRGFTKSPKSGMDLLYLEDVINPVNKFTGVEMAYPIKYFRELEIPPVIEEEIEQLLTEPVEMNTIFKFKYVVLCTLVLLEELFRF